MLTNHSGAAPELQNAPLSGMFSKITRLICLTVLLAAASGLFIQSTNLLCDGIGDYLKDKDAYLLRIFFVQEVSYSQAGRHDAIWDNFARQITEAEVSETPVIAKVGAQTPSLTLKIGTVKNELRCQYLLTGPTTLIDKLNNEGGYQTEEFVGQLLGNVTVNGDVVAFQKPSIDIPGDNKPATLSIDSTPISGRFFEIEFAAPPKTKHLKFAGKEIEVRAKWADNNGNQLETETHSGDFSRYKLTWSEAHRFSLPQLFINVESTSQSEDEPLSRLMERSGLLNLPFFGGLAETLLASVPYILVLLLIKRNFVADHAKYYQLAIALVLALWFVIAFLGAIWIGAQQTALASHWVEAFAKRAAGISGDIHPPYSLSRILITLFAGLLWPILASRVLADGAKSLALAGRRSRIAIVIALSISIALTAAWLVWLSSQPQVPAFVFALYLLAIMGILSFWFLWELFSGWKAWIGALAAVTVMVLISVWTNIPRYINSTPSYRFIFDCIAVATVLIFGIPLVTTFLKISLTLVPNTYLERLLRLRWARFGVGVAICLPTTWFVNADQIGPGAVWTLAYRLINLFLFVLILLLLHILHDEASASPWPLLSPLAIKTGIVLALASFYSSTSIWFYFPIPLVLGYVLLKWFLLKAPTESVPSTTLLEQWSTVVRNTLQMRRLERVAAAMKKGLEKKLTNAEITWTDYQDRLKPVTQALETEQESLLIDNRPAQPLLFSCGTAGSPWGNGRQAAIYSLCFALPWILLSLRDVLNSHEAEPYVLLAFLNSAAMIIARWTLYGFFFGYFYAYIRGKNGFQKALSLWFSLALPSVLASLLSSSVNRTNLAALVFWTAQVFVHCIILGLFIGELQSLRKAGFGWRQLVEFHNLTSLSAWGSSLVVALGAAITAALSTGLQSLITLGLKYVGVLPQGPVPGK